MLCVDDDATLLQSLRALLVSRLGEGHWIEIAESGAEALEVWEDYTARRTPIALVISDFLMPGMRGDELLVRLHRSDPAMIKVLLTGQSDLSGVKRCINEAGLYRFIEKPFEGDDLVLTTQTALLAYAQARQIEHQNEVLRSANERLEAEVSARTAQLQEKNVELERLAHTDRLTGLSNRHALDRVLREEAARARRFDHPFSVILLDIDHFKRINDGLGHGAGDQVLIDVARVLTACVRELDVAGRWGGEEFLLVCRDTSLEGAQVLADKLRARIEADIVTASGPVTASLGVTQHASGEEIHVLLGRADGAMYQAKALGRNRVCVAPMP
ncbi:GGDEF domain-containing response regulator [Inhella gelatinilytica]|uniref:diguanylate cyclase n=1 Tax=Inhella gelatinilytica TaxID=2795030 RepID=A0A931NDQ9_9BURK|nr:diguanylate cyclase [Inhella gelatinilytica]MBH9552500.1 diguanylate cyclase [Inhella gelatinilytica]